MAVRRVVFALALPLAALVPGGCSPPQMGADDGVFAAVDALFTAVTARDEGLLGKCEGQLHALRDEGRLPAEAAGYLDGVIARARKGGWESAAERLYDFMKAQRRDGDRGPRAKETKMSGSAKGAKK